MLVPIVFAAAGLIIILGFVGSYFFKRTMVPDILWLLTLGIMLGPVLKTVDPSLFAGLTPFFAAIAVMIILFQGGIQTNIYTLISQSPRSILLACLSIIFSMLASAVFTFYVLDWPLMNGLLLGAILGGCSSPIIISISTRLPFRDSIKTLLNIESTLTDALCIIIAIVLVEIMVFGSYSIATVGQNLIGSFSIGATMGLFTGLIWIAGLSRLHSKEFEYMLVLAILLLLYAFVESVNGSGAIASFVFGVVIANGRELSHMLRLKKESVTHAKVERFHNEVSFLVRTFFFVYMGLIVSFGSWYIILVSIFLTIVLLLVRFVSVHFATMGMDIINEEKILMSILIPRGLAAAVLTQIPILYGIPYSGMYADIVVTVIFMSIFFTSIGVASMKDGTIKTVKTLTDSKRPASKKPAKKKRKR